MVRTRQRRATHLHAVEEVLTVLQGEAEIWLADVTAPIAAGQSWVIPAGRRHGFCNPGSEILHVTAALAAPIFEASFDDRNEIARRWLPG